MTEMVKITFFKRDGVYYGFRETGHAEFDDAGKDIVCAAVSAMTMLVINAIEVSYASNVEYSIDEDTADIEVRAYGACPETARTLRSNMPFQVLYKPIIYSLSICLRIMMNISMWRKQRTERFAAHLLLLRR